MLRDNCQREIQRMVNGEALMRIGHLWFGNTGSTVHMISYAPSKQIDTARGLRMESAIAYSNSRPPIDTLQVEIIISYQRFDLLAELCAMLQVTPVLPVMNLIVAMAVQPIDMNRDVYLAYGIPGDDLIVATDLLDDDGKTYAGTRIPGRRRQFEIYASVPVQMRIDGVNITSVEEAPRELRVVVTMTRVLTANSYGHRPQYLRSYSDVVLQEEYIHTISQRGGDTTQTVAIGEMFGIQTRQLNRMITSMRRIRALSGTNPDSVGERFSLRRVVHVENGVWFVGERSDGRMVLLRLFAVEAHASRTTLAGLYGLQVSGVSIPESIPTLRTAYAALGTLLRSDSHRLLLERETTMVRTALSRAAVMFEIVHRGTKTIVPSHITDLLNALGPAPLDNLVDYLVVRGRYGSDDTSEDITDRMVEGGLLRTARGGVLPAMHDDWGNAMQTMSSLFRDSSPAMTDVDDPQVARVILTRAAAV